MTVTANPKRKQDSKAQAFIAGAAKRLSMSSSAFIISSATERAERMEA